MGDTTDIVERLIVTADDVTSQYAPSVGSRKLHLDTVTEAAAEIARLRAVNAELRSALSELASYSASAWFDEADASDEEHKLVGKVRAALYGAA